MGARDPYHVDDLPNGIVRIGKQISCPVHTLGIQIFVEGHLVLPDEELSQISTVDKIFVGHLLEGKLIHIVFFDFFLHLIQNDRRKSRKTLLLLMI